MATIDEFKYRLEGVQQFGSDASPAKIKLLANALSPSEQPRLLIHSMDWKSNSDALLATDTRLIIASSGMLSRTTIDSLEYKNIESPKITVYWFWADIEFLHQGEKQEFRSFSKRGMKALFTLLQERYDALRKPATNSLERIMQLEAMFKKNWLTEREFSELKKLHAGK